ncbi:hypothetical protein RJ641_022055 [Dillenia turbinata]|uniref:Uncharacterized protein n=1 Tax=Dillenia turbinata TaxID=194707 RepID=A0AAN8UGR0_9MAGN
MHVSDFLSRLDLSWFLQLLFTLILLGIGFIHLLKNTASKYFEVDANFDSASPDRMPVPEEHQSSFAIDTMQSVCLDEFGGEKAVSPSSQETTLIQHIFGGHLQSQNDRS